MELLENEKLNKHQLLLDPCNRFKMLSFSELFFFNFCSTGVDEETLERMKRDLKNLDKCLGPYPYDIWKKWRDLTNHIDVEVVKRCKPVCGWVNVVMVIICLFKREEIVKIRDFHIKLCSFGPGAGKLRWCFEAQRRWGYSKTTTCQWAHSRS